MKVKMKASVMVFLTMAAVACGSGQGATGGASSGTSGSGGGDPIHLPVGVPVPSPSEVEQFFVDIVYPALIKDCGSCHTEGQLDGPIFLTSEAHTAYAFLHEYNMGALVEPPETNLLLQKDRHEGPDIGGPTRAAVQQWLALEYPNWPAYDFPLVLYPTLVNFGQCLSKQGFLDRGLDQLFNLPTDAVTGAACTCATCHNKSDAASFGGDLILDPDADLTFAGLQQFPGMMVFAQGQVNDKGTFSGLVASHRIELKGQEPNILSIPNMNGPDEPTCLCDPNNRLDPAVNFGLYCHPTYALDQALIDNIDAFVETALTRQVSIICSADNTK